MESDSHLGVRIKKRKNHQPQTFPSAEFSARIFRAIIRPVITLAVSKGRIWRETLPLLQRAGIAPVSAADARSIILPTADSSVRLIVVRAFDVPAYIACGAAEAGIAGRDVLAERAMEGVYQPLDLRIGRCRLAVAARENFDYESAARRGARFRVAAKHLSLARAHFAAKGIHADFVELRGALELAPLVGLADVIVDLVDTGDTLRANKMREVEKIMEVSAHLIFNRAAAKRRRMEMKSLQQRFADAMKCKDDGND